MAITSRNKGFRSLVARKNYKQLVSSENDDDQENDRDVVPFHTGRRTRVSSSSKNNHKNSSRSPLTVLVKNEYEDYEEELQQSPVSVMAPFHININNNNSLDKKNTQNYFSTNDENDDKDNDTMTTSCSNSNSNTSSSSTAMNRNATTTPTITATASITSTITGTSTVRSPTSPTPNRISTLKPFPRHPRDTKRATASLYSASVFITTTDADEHQYEHDIPPHINCNDISSSNCNDVAILDITSNNNDGIEIAIGNPCNSDEAMCKTDLMQFDADIFDNAGAAAPAPTDSNENPTFDVDFMEQTQKRLMQFDADIFDNTAAAAAPADSNENQTFDADFTEQTQTIHALSLTPTATPPLSSPRTLPPLLSVPLYSPRLVDASEDNDESSPFNVPFPSASTTTSPCTPFSSTFTSTATFTSTSTLPSSFTLSPPLSPTAKTATAAAETTITQAQTPNNSKSDNKGSSVFVLDYDACHCGDNNSNFNGDRVVECIDSADGKPHEAACGLFEISACAGEEVIESMTQSVEGLILSQGQDKYGHTHQALDGAASEFEESVNYYRALLEEHITIPCCGAADTVAEDKSPTNTITGSPVLTVEIEVQLKATA